jgi:hypothetical protein
VGRQRAFLRTAEGCGYLVRDDPGFGFAGYQDIDKNIVVRDGIFEPFTGC